MSSLVIAFVHGYSVTSFDTYGELPLRIRNEALARGLDVKIEQVFLARYITFHDKVLLSDVARALEQAVQEQLPKGKRFVMVTHSTGGPLVRTWWRDFYQQFRKECPMSHLFMLAPANHGAALAQLGKTKLSRVKSWIDGLEPGQGILNWLELGSNEAWKLNMDWIFHNEQAIRDTQVFPFVVTAQNIDRKMYDHINSYTGEVGSDGVVRVASASINSAYLLLVQSDIEPTHSKGERLPLLVREFRHTNQTPLLVLRHKSHSGDDMGIMRSVKKEITDTANQELVDAFFKAIAVKDKTHYEAVFKLFAEQTEVNQKELRVEVAGNLLRPRHFIHDKQAQVIFKIVDDMGEAVTDFDLLITGSNCDPDVLPSGFFTDRQCNSSAKNKLTYYFNCDVMSGTGDLFAPDGKLLRPSLKGMDEIGIKVIPRPERGFVRYAPAFICEGEEFFKKVLRPNSTTLVEIILKRIVSDQTFKFENTSSDSMRKLVYKDVEPGNGTIG